uniref:Probable G-protein coupled receptor Mth-like 1 n=1 Tax=Cacopsylla melanoneura TaxID=428564 RepID=A0A8D8LLW3_9HEMI
MTIFRSLKMSSRLFLPFLLLCLTRHSVANDSLIQINKCCNDNEFLNEQLECVRSEVPLPQWSPIIYQPEVSGFLAPGTIPENWAIIKPSKPNCDESSRGPSGDKYSLKFIVAQENGLPPSYVNFDNGSLYLQDHPELISNRHYCIENNAALVCLKVAATNSALDALKGKIFKCCGDNAVYSESKKSCMVDPNVDYWNLNENFTIIGGFPACVNSHYAIHGRLDETYSLNIDGTLSDSHGKNYNQSYCIEKTYENLSEKASIFVCANTYSGFEKDVRFSIYPIGLAISIVFLILTLLSTLLLPCTYHVLHWRCQINYIVCLLFADVLLCFTQFLSMYISPTLCVLSAIAMHFLFLAAFFWLNTMCFNIWWTFRDIRPTSLDKTQETFRLRMYELYAWGVPLVISGIGALMDLLPSEYQPNMMKPKFGEKRCWFYGDAEILPYFFLPIGILLFLNLTLFMATARELTCGLWKTEVVKSTNERATLGRVCLKLVIVMGITWVADILSWGIGGPNYMWYFTDMINTLQGLLIFIVVGCQPQVIAALRRWLNGSSATDNGMGGTSSTNAPSVLNESTTKPVETLC